MINRALSPTLALSKKSILLLGPRQTGKSTLIHSLNPNLTINLAHEPTYLDFLSNPRQLEQQLAPFKGNISVLIDEVQRLPSLLNTVQVLLDDPKNKVKFYLTGSSARKLKRGHANLLPGRIHTYNLNPLSCGELGYALETSKGLAYGTLPGVWVETDLRTKEKTLRSYAATYIKEEVQAENLSRNLEGFARFLNIAAAWSGQFLDLAKLSSLAQIARQTAVRYFEVLEECLVVRRFNAFSGSLVKRMVQHPKFYFFDNGVLNALLGNFTVSEDRIGNLFEHLIYNQIMNEAGSLDKDISVTTYRTEHGMEVDMIIELEGEVYAVEIKASKSIHTHQLRGLEKFREHYEKKHRSIILYQGETIKEINGIHIWPWQQGIYNIFNQGNYGQLPIV